MCCVFTCAGWLLDLFQKCWMFAMACIICGAICCVLLAASMAGIALGYNYSLAEYVDLKETNVSVYLKRGMFDDEINEEMDWRRAGHLPIQGHIGGGKLITASVAEVDESADQVSTLASRRLDDSIIEADDAYKYEGSLMKITEKPTPPAQEPSTEYVTMESDKKMQEYALSNNNPQKSSLEHLKALQGLINRKKAEFDPVWTVDRTQMGQQTEAATRIDYYKQGPPSKYKPDDAIKVPEVESGRRAMHPLNYDNRAYGDVMRANRLRPPPEAGRRMLNPEYELGPYRSAVPPPNRELWKLAKAKQLPYPEPVVPQIGFTHSRPTRPFDLYALPQERMRYLPKNPVEDVRKLKSKLFYGGGGGGKSDVDSSRLVDKSVESENTKMPDYDEENGVPVRKKRDASKTLDISTTSTPFKYDNDIHRTKSLLTKLSNTITTREVSGKKYSDVLPNSKIIVNGTNINKTEETDVKGGFEIYYFM